MKAGDWEGCYAHNKVKMINAVSEIWMYLSTCQLYRKWKGPFV